MSEKQLIVVVEGTAAMGRYWSTIVSDYLEKIIRSFCASDSMGQAKGTPEMSLVMFNSHGCYSAFLVQRSGWTRNVDIFMQWLAALSFIGGGFNDAAIAEGLSEALMMFTLLPNGSQVQVGIDGQKHCILIAASNPYPLPTPVYRPQLTIDQGENVDGQQESRLHDAETVAKSFPLVNVSLSVICPKKLSKLNVIYIAGRRSGRASDLPIDDAKNPNYLVLISEMFMEARTSLSHSGIQSLPSNQSPVKPDVTPSTVSTPIPSSNTSASNGSLMNRSPASTNNVPVATVKVEPGAANTIASPPTFSHIPTLSRPSSQTVPSMQTSSPASASQDVAMNGESMLDTKPAVNGSVRSMPSSAANVNILNNLSQVRQAMNSAALSSGTSMGLPSINQTMHMPTMMTNTSQSSAAAVSSSPSQLTPPNATLSQYGSPPTNPNLGISQPMNQPNPNTMIPTPSISQPNPGVGATSSTNPMQTAQSKYVRVWEGNLSGQRQGQPVFITRLEGYRNSSSSETLAANWPPTMQIVRLLSQDHMNNKQYVGKADFLVFRALNQHGFLGQLQEKKLCAVIQLPSQTLLLSVSDKASRLIGMLFPGDMVVFKPQPSNQQQQQQFSQLQHQQQQQQIAQPYGRTQLVPQPQVSSNLPGGPYIS